MGISVTLSSKRESSVNPILFASKPTDLIEEIEQFRLETARLERVYELHRKLGESLDLDSMMEAFSRWLAPLLRHDLVAYRHFGRVRMPTACSCHGPHRQLLMESAFELLENPITEEKQGIVESLGLYYHIWPLGKSGRDNLLLVHRQSDSTWKNHSNKIESILEDLQGPIERALVYEDLYEQARRDALTGLDNRRVFLERAKQEMTCSERYGQPLILACLDLDHFKSINDQLGHGEGDLVLKRVSEEFTRCVRDSDVLARIGGDEFAMILPNTPLSNAHFLMDRICHSIKGLGFKAPDADVLGVSIGLAQWPAGATLEEWWELADAALYRAKNNGRSQASL
ncbi:MAG: GGDEF domain-containing protein [Magnetococcales bacterium]|nr:GGDEF domain-containing protein [Magnetococcales bacterium]